MKKLAQLVLYGTYCEIHAAHLELKFVRVSWPMNAVR
jgi:hypothetical protein